MNEEIYDSDGSGISQPPSEIIGNDPIEKPEETPVSFQTIFKFFLDNLVPHLEV